MFDSLKDNSTSASKSFDYNKILSFKNIKTAIDRSEGSKGILSTLKTDLKYKTKSKIADVLSNIPGFDKKSETLKSEVENYNISKDVQNEQVQLRKDQEKLIDSLKSGNIGTDTELQETVDSLKTVESDMLNLRKKQLIAESKLEGENQHNHREQNLIDLKVSGLDDKYDKINDDISNRLLNIAEIQRDIKVKEVKIDEPTKVVIEDPNKDNEALANAKERVDSKNFTELSDNVNLGFAETSEENSGVVVDSVESLEKNLVKSILNLEVVLNDINKGISNLEDDDSMLDSLNPFKKKKGGKGIAGKAAGAVGGLARAATGGLGFSGLLGGTGATIAGAGAGAMTTAGALVAGAGAVGYGVGTLFNKGIDKLMDKVTEGESKSLGEYIYDKTHPKEATTPILRGDSLKDKTKLKSAIQEIEVQIDTKKDEFFSSDADKTLIAQKQQMLDIYKRSLESLSVKDVEPAVPTQPKAEAKPKSNDNYKSLKTKGAINHNFIGNSEITDWSAIENLSLEGLHTVINKDDWSSKDARKLQTIREKLIKESKSSVKEIESNTDTSKTIVETPQTVTTVKPNVESSDIPKVHNSVTKIQEDKRQVNKNIYESQTTPQAPIIVNAGSQKETNKAMISNSEDDFGIALMKSDLLG